MDTNPARSGFHKTYSITSDSPFSLFISFGKYRSCQSLPFHPCFQDSCVVNDFHLSTTLLVFSKTPSTHKCRWLGIRQNAWMTIFFSAWHFIRFSQHINANGVMRNGFVFSNEWIL